MRSHTISDFESTLGNEKVKTTRASRKVNEKIVKKKMSAGNSSNSSVSGRSSSKWEMFHNGLCLHTRDKDHVVKI